jgi:hypothetical protein
MKTYISPWTFGNVRWGQGRSLPYWTPWFPITVQFIFLFLMYTSSLILLCCIVLTMGWGPPVTSYHSMCQAEHWYNVMFSWTAGSWMSQMSSFTEKDIDPPPPQILAGPASEIQTNPQFLSEEASSWSALLVVRYFFFLMGRLFTSIKRPCSVLLSWAPHESPR